MRCFIMVAAVFALSFPLLGTEPNPSPRQRVLVQTLLDVMQVNKGARAMIDAIYAQLERQALASAEEAGRRPDQLEEVQEMFKAVREKSAKIDVASIMSEAYIQLYAKYFTEAELEALIAFYSTPVGKKSIDLMADLAREGMEAAERELSPKLEEIMAEVIAEQEKKRPWRRTMSDLRLIGTALDAYAIDHEDFYPTGDFASLKSTLRPTYVAEFPERDIWGHAYAYVVSPDRKRYRLVSAGADSIFDWDSRRVPKGESADPTEEIPIRYRDRLEDDIIFGERGFVQLPVKAKIEIEN